MSHLAQKDYSGNEGADNKPEQDRNKGLRLETHVSFKKVPLYVANAFNNLVGGITRKLTVDVFLGQT
jgi:hypothetical protein